MEKVKKLLIFLAFFLPSIFVFRSLFMGGSLAWGDAPFFYPENLKELFNLPYVWNFRNDNLGAPQFSVLWLYLPTFLYGLLNHFLSFGNDILVRIIFYFPSVILAIVGSWLFIGRFTRSLPGRFFGTFLYGFNTYFLTLVDGGQIGVALSYGLFPLAVTLSMNYLDKTSIKNYFPALISLFAIVNVDLRVAIIAVLFIIFWQIQQPNLRKRIINFLIMLFSVTVLSFYWILPFASNYKDAVSGVEGVLEDNNFINLINSIFLFQPHFPLNEFGKLASLPFYFALLPVLIFGGLIISKSKNTLLLTLALLFLIFAFLSKGGSPPFGEIYTFSINKLPFGVAFRDSSKFFIPLLLIAGVMFALTVGELKKLLKKRVLWVMVPTYLYLLLLINPALSGSLTGVLGKNIQSNDFSNLYSFLQKDDNFFRTLWFEEKPPLGFADRQRPAISANTLYQERPFASLISGQYDLFQFVRNSQIDQWWSLLGIKYVFFPGNERKKTLTFEDIKSQEERIRFIEGNSGLKKSSLPVSFPAFEIVNPQPHIFAQKKIFLVVGGEEIYYYLFTGKQFNLSNNAFVFLEDGKINSEGLLAIDSGDADLIFINKSQQDLMMSTLAGLFVPPSSAVLNEWQIRGKGEYLKWKYDLLKQDIKNFEFDFGKGVAFSTINGEKIEFNLNIPQDGNYYLAIRHLNAGGDSLKIRFSGQEKVIPVNQEGNFHWEIIGPQLFKEGQTDVLIQNQGGFNMLNTIAVISESDFNRAAKTTAQIMGHFQILQISGEKDLGDLSSRLDQNFIPVNFMQVDPTRYKILKMPPEARWLVFSDRYNKEWGISEFESSSHFPFYEMINGFYLKNTPRNFDLIFVPQKQIIPAILLSVISFFIIFFVILVKLFHKRKSS